MSPQPSAPDPPPHFWPARTAPRAMDFFAFASPPGPLRASFRLIYLCWRALATERTSDEFRLSPKRFGVLGALAVFLPSLACWNGLGFLLDDVFFRGYRRQRIEEPIFIQGGARTGTTALHRLLARDPELTAMSTWEIVFAPSVTWRRLFWFVGRLDRSLLGGALGALCGAAAARLASATRKVHEVQAFGAEEDEWLMAHIGASQLLGFFFTVLPELGPVIEFDSQLPQETKGAIFQYYASCIKRHLYAHGGSRTYVAKNPTFNRRIRWLQASFPDARFVMMVRPPEEAVPSLVSYIGSVWGAFCSPRTRLPMAKILAELQPGDIAYPLDALADWPAGRRAALSNGELRRDCAAAVEKLYGTLGLALTPAFRRELDAEAVVLKNWCGSGHHYSLEDTGMAGPEFEAHFAETRARVRRLEAGVWR
mmetsp:Transcript_25421/g.73329  ORF Transcript_25421/g.73329 Transcript_25421/m.73329 type:complete len:424 (-) Transcript_25421:73-1344(-)